MASKKVIWTQKANAERKAILEYWIERNKSKTYSLKLNKLFESAVRQIANNGFIGRKTKEENVRVKLVRDYLVFYEIQASCIKILSIWDTRRDEKTQTII